MNRFDPNRKKIGSAESAAKALLDRLLWWTSALAEARARTPCAA